jgi:hypothetical protein
MTKTEFRTPRMQIVWQVLEGAKDCQDQIVINACRRLINANTIGWRKHADKRDWQLVLEFAQ